MRTCVAQYALARQIDALLARVQAVQTQAEAARKKPGANVARIDAIAGVPPADDPRNSVGSPATSFTTLRWYASALGDLFDSVESADTAPTATERTTWAHAARERRSSTARLEHLVTYVDGMPGIRHLRAVGHDRAFARSPRARLRSWMRCSRRCLAVQLLTGSGGDDWSYRETITLPHGRVTRYITDFRDGRTKITSGRTQVIDAGTVSYMFEDGRWTKLDLRHLVLPRVHKKKHVRATCNSRWRSYPTM